LIYLLNDAVLLWQVRRRREVFDPVLLIELLEFTRVELPSTI
jgi:hypothetical protein